MKLKSWQKYVVINNILQTSTFELKTLCEIAEVSISGYYYFLKHRDSKEKKDYQDYLLIKTLFDKKKGKAGARIIKMDLEDVGVVMNLKKIQRIMKKYRFVCKIRRVNKARVSLQKNLENRFVPNLLNRRFKQNIPYTFLTTDITYLKHKERFSFLSVVKDMASGEILVWKLSKYMNLDLVLKTIDKLEMYYKARDLNLKNVLIHSDQGFQYTNIQYHRKLKELGMIQSMSRRGNSVDNAPIESFFGHMKDEIEYRNLNFNQLQDLINEYMLEYNYKRKQWGRQKMTPIFYRNYLLELRCK